MPAFHLAQFNIARTLTSLDSPVMADFVNALAEINALADSSPGFVWRLQSADGNATALRPFPDEQILVNMSVWESVEALKTYAYKSAHVNFVRRRSEWFDSLEKPFVVLWWIPAEHTPTVSEAKERLDHLRAHGEMPHAFSFQTLFPPSN
jgi:hypothetical protein